MYVGIDIQKNIQSRNWYILHTYVRTQYKSKILHTQDLCKRKKYVCRNQYSTRERNGAQELDGVTALYSRYEQITTKIQHKCVVLHKIYSPYAYLQGDGRTDARTDARTHARTENIYSIFRDKLLLLGEHGHQYFLLITTYV